MKLKGHWPKPKPLVQLSFGTVVLHLPDQSNPFIAVMRCCCPFAIICHVCSKFIDSVDQGMLIITYYEPCETQLRAGWDCVACAE